MDELPIPPLAMREAVGPTDPSAFDNPSGSPIFPNIPPESYDSVLDFGCGCGRLARQMIQQDPRPRSYLGIDLHKPLVDWASENLSPRASGFKFLHHDIHYPEWNPGESKPPYAPFPTGDSTCSLVIAYSVFTHLIQAHAVYYLEEVARVLTRDGVFISTWFLFDKALFPMMQDFQDALYINEVSPTNAVIFDRNWVVETAASNGLTVTAVEQPLVRGFQWTLTMRPAELGIEPVELPDDEAPISAEGVRAAVAPNFDEPAGNG